MWRRNKAIESPWHGTNLNSYPKRRFLGYSGMDIGTIRLLEAGGRRQDRKEAARWGFAMYIADDPAMWVHRFLDHSDSYRPFVSAKYFANWIKGNAGFSQTIVCSIWARDSDIWDRMNKVSSC